MIDFKTADFFSDYFKGLLDFNLTVPFEEKDNSLFVGVIEPKESIHPVSIRVEVPKTFPYHKLVFWTNSLYGYPHLIYSSNRNSSWFCLNTSFAETAEKQLDAEMDKLRGWIKLMMHKKLPAVIPDSRSIRALRFANAYSWEVFDNDEYNSDARLIFVGVNASSMDQFGNKGFLHCKRVQLDDNQSRFYAFPNNNDGLEEIPYVVVNEVCEDFGSLNMLIESYGWEDEITEYLLPHMYRETKFSTRETIFDVDLKDLNQKLIDIDQHFEETSIPSEYSWLVYDEISLLKWHAEAYKKNQKHAPIITNYQDEDNPERDFTPGMTLLGEEMAQRILSYYNKEYYFALGINNGESLSWYLFSTTRNKKKQKVIPVKVGNLEIPVYELLDVELSYQRASIIDYKHYFGRGSHSQSLSNLNIAIVGVGAIGSFLLESLVRGGAKQISIWDGDYVEPGNICRSIYTISDIGKSKVLAASDKIKEISPYCSIKTYCYNLYGDINYRSQQDIINELEPFDVIFDCTASNEFLHFLSYAVKDKLLMSLCITNHANDILCLSSTDGNVYEQRKIFLSKIEQDTNNFYVEGTGCFSPTFLATYGDINSLVNIFVHNFDQCFLNNSSVHSSFINTDNKSQIQIDKLNCYRLPSFYISLFISDRELSNLDNLPDVYDYAIGYILGSYSEDRKMIYVSNVLRSENVLEDIININTISEGVIDYIGEVHYSSLKSEICEESIKVSIINKALDPDINTNNPLLIIREIDGSYNFYILIDNQFHKFNKA